MAWVYLDDGFFDHPKVVAAGGDAALLFIAALAYCKRNRLPGRVRKEMIPRLTDRARPVALASHLVKVGLFDLEAEDFVVHDWDQWNRTGQAKSARGRKGAQARWKDKPGQSSSNVSGDAQAMPEHPPSNGLVPVPSPVVRDIPVPNALPRPSETRDVDTHGTTSDPLLDHLKSVCVARKPQVVNLEAVG